MIKKETLAISVIATLWFFLKKVIVWHFVNNDTKDKKYFSSYISVLKTTIVQLSKSISSTWNDFRFYEFVMES